MFYERKHPLTADYFCTEHGNDFSFPRHIHSCFEFVTVLDGEMHISIDAHDYLLHCGESVLIFPNQVHSLTTRTSSSHMLCIFSDKLVNSFYEKKRSLLPENNLFILPSYLSEQLPSLDRVSLLRKKGFLYSLVGCFDENATYDQAQCVSEARLLFNIFSYIEQNFSSSCSLADMARALGYNDTYLSKYFKRTVGMHFHDYVTHHRIRHACHLLRTTDKTILDISADCGYSTLRSFYRNFRSLLDVSPHAYRLFHAEE